MEKTRLILDGIYQEYLGIFDGYVSLTEGNSCPPRYSTNISGT